MPLIALFILWPLIEIGLIFIVVGWIGLWLALGIVLGTGLLGLSILRGSGLRSVADVRHTVTGVQSRIVPLAQGVMSVLGAMLLILPGFIGDLLGLFLLIPPVQLLVVQAATDRLRRAGAFAPPTRSADTGTVIDGEFTELDPDDRVSHTPRQLDVTLRPKRDTKH